MTEFFILYFLNGNPPSGSGKTNQERHGQILLCRTANVQTRTGETNQRRNGQLQFDIAGIYARRKYLENPLHPLNRNRIDANKHWFSYYYLIIAFMRMMSMRDDLTHNQIHLEDKKLNMDLKYLLLKKSLIGLVRADFSLNIM